MNAITIQPIDTTQIAEEEKLTALVLTTAEGIVIKTQAQYVDASGALKEVKAHAKRLEDMRKSITGPLDLAKKNIMDLFRKPAERLFTAENLIKRGLIAYQTEQERVAREQEDKLRKQAEREAKRLQDRAEKAAEGGNTEKANDLLQKAEEKKAMTPTVEVQTPLVAGVSMREEWKFDVEDASKVPSEYMVPDMVKIGQVVRATKGTLAIPGIKIYAVKNIASRR